MGKIQELSVTLANQIAAGEVVERPASVVKELVENAIDAGSSQIDILIEEAGLKKIQVIDNGEGISQTDVLNAFKRHATSKIHTRDDLFRIRSLGFRGEALPSIASVSELEIETAVQSEPEGSFVKMRGGEVIQHQAAPLRQGTKITVENLFFNTPARLKYVKTIQTELANIGDIVNRLALSHPNIAFRLVHEGNKMLTTTGSGDLKQTIAGIYGVATAKKMIAITSQDLDFNINGFVSLPEVTRASRNYLSTIINGRYIKNFALNKAIVNGYGSKLMVGRFPIAVIEIQMDPLLVDVNVHPTKQEVRLSKEKELTELLTKAIQVALQEEQLIPNAADNLRFKKKIANQDKVEQIKMDLSTQSQGETPAGKLAFDPQTGDFFIHTSSTELSTKPVGNSMNEGVKSPKTPTDILEETAIDQELSAVSEEKRGGQATGDNFADSLEETSIIEEIPFGNIELSTEPLNKLSTIVDNEIEKAEEPIEKPKPSQQRFPELEYFGQMHGTYLFAQSGDGLYIVDQHAAQERVKYEEFRERIGEVSDDLQELLIPIVLDYPSNDALQLKEKADLLAEVGIHLEEFGQNSFIVRAHPTWYPLGEEEATIREMIDMLLTNGQISVKKFREDTAIMMSCKQSIKANHHLDVAQARQLLVDLAKCENPFNCPHGRPVLIHFTNSDMERMFKRIQDPH